MRARAPSASASASASARSPRLHGACGAELQRGGDAGRWVVRNCAAIASGKRAVRAGTASLPKRWKLQQCRASRKLPLSQWLSGSPVRGESRRMCGCGARQSLSARWFVRGWHRSVHLQLHRWLHRRRLRGSAPTATAAAAAAAASARPVRFAVPQRWRVLDNRLTPRLPLPSWFWWGHVPGELGPVRR